MLTHLMYQPRKAGAPASPCPKDGNQAHGRIGALLQPALGAGWAAGCGQVCLGWWRCNPRAFLLPGAQEVSQQAKRPASKSVAVTTAHQCRPWQGRLAVFPEQCAGGHGREWGLFNQRNILTIARLLRPGSQMDLGLAWSKAVPPGLSLLTCKVGRVTPASQS